MHQNVEQRIRGAIQDRALTIAEIVEAIGVHERTVYRRVAALVADNSIHTETRPGLPGHGSHAKAYRWGAGRASDDQGSAAPGPTALASRQATLARRSKPARKPKRGRRGMPRGVSRWIPSTVKPVHLGVYQVKFLGVADFSYARWDGKRWCASRPTAALADEVGIEIAGISTMRWRGRRLKKRQRVSRPSRK
ncbi:hypothetical protein WKW79_35510 [Variovorax robiniae]|uniref:Helix-turn-helix type 11 domain-containing protein n=1 Tax=Variovorax robiniae TaxID=1836199 RepID=A0ABU8XJ97_9BURK